MTYPWSMWVHSIADLRRKGQADRQIASARDLDAEFAKMLPHFAGKETEHNWTPREKAVVRVRGMLRGEAHRQYPEAFLAGMKGGIFEGVSRTVSFSLQKSSEHRLT